jgi:hypothetical protein
VGTCHLHGEFERRLCLQIQPAQLLRQPILRCLLSSVRQASNLMLISVLPLQLLLLQRQSLP